MINILSYIIGLKDGLKDNAAFGYTCDGHIFVFLLYSQIADCINSHRL